MRLPELPPMSLRVKRGFTRLFRGLMVVHGAQIAGKMSENPEVSPVDALWVIVASYALGAYTWKMPEKKSEERDATPTGL